MKRTWARTACSHPALSGISRAHLGGSLEEIYPKWQARRESELHKQRGGERRRAAGAGRLPKLEFVDRVLVTLVHLRLDMPHAALAELYDVDRSTISAAIRDVRSLLAARGFAIPERPGQGIRTLEDLFAYAGAEGVDLRIDGTEVQVRRPRAGHPGRKAFVSGKKKQNTIKTTTFSDAQRRTLLSGVVRPGRMQDRTAVRTEGIAEQFRRHPRVRAEVDEGYRGLANEFPNQVSAPPKKPNGDAPLGEHHARREQRSPTPTGTGSGGSTPASLRAERHPAAGPERTRRAAAPGTPTSRGEVGFSELAKHERGRSGGGLGTRFPSPPTTGHGAPDSAASAAVGPSGRPMKRPHIERRRGRR
ncbi:transposase family protein [Streptomyces sp. NBC_00183]|uniref:transposase family protein n=1 Tax=unclassified Streptomyces TaxID=2593676 RepID=UPI00224D3A6A|nr:transposase family protein [Streptomyces sp. NBC_00183]MCX5294309.1 transposase family protein [Streptomyces sp. NBC_00183]